MATVRVTQSILVDRVLNNLFDQQSRILTLQDQLATGQKVNTPSDDPLAARRAINSQSVLTKNEQYITNISTSRPGLVDTETSILNVVRILQRANELTLQGTTDTNGQVQRDQIATEVDNLIEGVLEEANRVTNGRYIFGGTHTLNRPFVETRNAANEVTSVAYEGNDKHFQIEISDDVRVNINETGSDAFTQTSPQTVDIFQVLIGIRDNLRAGDTAALEANLAELDSGQDQMLVSTARLGAVQNRMDRVDASIRVIGIQLREVISDNIDADFAEVTLELNAASNAFQAALNAGARVIQPSLLQFLG